MSRSVGECQDEGAEGGEGKSLFEKVSAGSQRKPSQTSTA